MAFDVEMLGGLGIPQDKADAIIAAHEEVVTALQAQADQFRAEMEEAKPRAEETRRMEAELAALMENAPDYKAMYEAEKAAFDSLKAEQRTKEAEARKRERYKDLLREAGVQARRIDSIARLCDVSRLRFDAAGNLENPEAIRADIRREWGDFIPKKYKGGLT